MAKEKRIRSPKVETDVLTQCKRRCCICYGLHHDESVKEGQIAHLDGNPSNNDMDNLAYLCLPCHDKYDSRTSQSKGFQINEAKRYRQELHDWIKREWENTEGVESPSSDAELNSDLDDADIKNLLTDYLHKRVSSSPVTLDYRTIDSELGFPNGTSARYARHVAEHLDLAIMREGGSTILLKKKPQRLRSVFDSRNKKAV